MNQVYFVHELDAKRLSSLLGALILVRPWNVVYMVVSVPRPTTQHGTLPTKLFIHNKLHIGYILKQLLLLLTRLPGLGARRGGGGLGKGGKKNLISLLMMPAAVPNRKVAS